MADRRPIDSRVEVGRVHLTVADIERALGFYQGVLGFGLTLRVGNASALLSADGSHPHIELRRRDSGDLPPQRSAEAARFALRYPDRETLSDALQRLTAAGVPIDGARDLGLGEALYLRDPDGNAVELYYDRAPADWPRGADGSLLVSGQPLDPESLRTPATAAPADAPRTAEEELTPPLSEMTRGRLRDMRLRLLTLHKVLLDDAKASYEMDRGRITSSATLLQLVIYDPWFAWLHPLSELVVRIDETLQPEAPATEADGVVLLEEVERLLSPALGGGRFADRYYEALQRQPAVILAHAEVRRILKQAR